MATYQILTYRPDKTEDFPHFELFDERDWGLIIYDEVHLLPAPVFRVTAQIQARRRLGLTATLIREDGREGDVFCLIGPKKYDVPWRELETKGWIAAASCTEVRVALPDDETRMEYAVADQRAKYRIASENAAKDEVVAELLERYHDQRVLDHRPVPDAAAAAARSGSRSRSSPARRRSPSARTCTASSARARCGTWSCRRSATSRSTCRTRTC